MNQSRGRATRAPVVERQSSHTRMENVHGTRVIGGDQRVLPADGRHRATAIPCDLRALCV
ncbi:MAG TPA: hypothetical protein VFP16_01130 [Vicinamibacterales bacterium]|nr:hypothetical protein [Vicinamibacterales bacterium]